MARTFTIEEIRIYLLKQDSFGDVLHFLNEENIVKAVEEDKEANDIEDDEDEKF